MKVTRTSEMSRKAHTMELDITQEQLERIEKRYETKELIQDIVPNLSNDQREFLISGVTPEEWKEMFGSFE